MKLHFCSFLLSEIEIIRRYTDLHRLTDDNRSLSIGTAVVDSVVVRALESLLDSELTMEPRLQPRRQRRILPPSSAETISAPYYSRHQETARLLFNAEDAFNIRYLLLGQRSSRSGDSNTQLYVQSTINNNKFV